MYNIIEMANNLQFICNESYSFIYGIYLICTKVTQSRKEKPEYKNILKTLCIQPHDRAEYNFIALVNAS